MLFRVLAPKTARSYGLVFMHTIRPICKIRSSCSLAAQTAISKRLQRAVSIWKVAVCNVFEESTNQPGADDLVSMLACKTRHSIKCRALASHATLTHGLSLQSHTIMSFFKSSRATFVHGRTRGARFGDRRKSAFGRLFFSCAIYTVSGKKRDQHVFCNISYKIPAIMMKFGT